MSRRRLQLVLVGTKTKKDAGPQRRAPPPPRSQDGDCRGSGPTVHARRDCGPSEGLLHTPSAGTPKKISPAPPLRPCRLYIYQRQTDMTSRNRLSLSRQDPAHEMEPELMAHFRRITSFTFVC